MGTHPIFESDFDCLTDRSVIEMSDAKYSPLGKLSALQQVQVRLGNTGIRVSPLGIGVALLLVFSLGYYTVSSPVAMKSNEQEVSIKELIKASIEFAERGGNILVDIRKQADIGEQSKGAHDDVKEGPGSNDPVTQGDFQLLQLFISHLEKVQLGHGLVPVMVELVTLKINQEMHHQIL